MVGKKKRGHPDIEELLARPWCYYCERDFDDLKILISHQKAKHFKCERCGRRLNTAGGLSVHMNQVHKETLTSVDNSLPNRQGLEVEIFGMEGIPEEVAQAHNQRIIAGFYQAEAERRAATGNPGPGVNNSQGGPKKPKFESPADIKKRLAEHKARKAEQAVNGTSGDNTPMADTPIADSPGAFNGSPFAPPQASYGNSQGAGFGTFSQEPYAQPAAAYSQSFPPQHPAFSGPPGAQMPPYATPPGYQQPQQNFPGAPGAPGQYTAGSPPGAFNGGYTGPPSYTPPGVAGGLPNRPPNLPSAPGLPQRPAFGATSVAPYQMQQMHQGGVNSQYPGPQQGNWSGSAWNGQDNSAMSSAPPNGYNGGYPTNAPGTGANGQQGDDIDAMIRAIEAGQKPPKPVDATAAVAPPIVPLAEATPTPAAPDTAAKADVSEKKSKKDKPIHMVYSDSELSPEERMAKMPRYAFVPEKKTETALFDASTVPDVAGTVDE